MPAGTTPPVRLRRVLPAEPTSAASARRFAREALREGREEPLTAVVTLLVSELVTNAVLHAGSQMEVGLAGQRARVRVEVADDPPVFPTIRHYGADAATGRGLGLVQELTDQWGVDRRPGDG